GLLAVNSSIVDHVSRREDIEIVEIEANQIAEELGSVKMMNMAMVGAMLARRPVFDLACVEQALRDHLPASKAHLLEKNLQVLRRGFAVGDTILV
ncbi:MAG: 2-oxoacid:acceptor oxidoreductase family protein, partial [Chloroflexota bacterium]